MQTRDASLAQMPRELTADECGRVGGGLSAEGAEALPGGIVEPNPVGFPTPPLGSVSGG